MDDTDAAVNVIFTAHTHMKYSYTDPAHNNRPIIQTGSYAANIGQVVLTYNTATGAVSYDKSGNTSVQVLRSPPTKMIRTTTITPNTTMACSPPRTRLSPR